MGFCPAQANWQRINGAVRVALDSITLAEMAQTIPAAFGRAHARQETRLPA
jgi:DNA-binding IscR family transcriptional regulator